MALATYAAVNLFWLWGLSLAAVVPSRGEVRSPDPTIQRLVAETRLRSATFAELVGCVESAGVIVYVVPAASLRRGLSAALQLSAAGAGGFRYLKIVVRPGARANRRVADLAHELGHICEAARAGALVSDAALAAYFRNHAVQEDGAARAVYETAAGGRAAAAVLRELREGVGLLAETSDPRGPRVHRPQP